MLDVSYNERVQALKKKFEADPENLEVVLEWEKKLHGLSSVDDFMKLEPTRAIVKSLKERLLEVYKDKAYKTDWTPEDLRCANARIKELQHIIAVFMPSFEDELNYLSQELERALAL